MRFIKERYLDPEERFWDYGTEDIKWLIPNKLPSSDIFDTSTLGGFSAYDEYLHDPKYIQRVTPKEYFEQAAKGFGTTFESQVKQVESDKEVLDHLRDVIFVANKKFPMAFISRSNGRQQEGRHRMYIAASIFGWNKSFPVLVLP